MAVTARVIAGVVALLALSQAPGAVSLATAASTAAGAPVPGLRGKQTAGQDLTVTIAKVGNGTIRPQQRLVVHGTVANPGSTQWLDAQVYLQITPTPASSLPDLQYFASVPDDPGLGNTIFAIGLFDQIGDVAPGDRIPFTLSIPYDDLGITELPGVYRVGVHVVAGTTQGRVPAGQTSTLMPLLPTGSTPPVPAQTVTLLPLSAPIKRLSNGAFADDSLRNLISAQGRLTNVLDWVTTAPPGTVQVVIDPALLLAITDMSDGYLVQPADKSTAAVAGNGQTEATVWLQKFAAVEDAQHLMFMPWGVPAVSSLLEQQAPGPAIAAVEASQHYRDVHAARSFVAGWLTNGSSGVRAITMLHHVGVDLQIVSQDSLPALASYPASGRYVPSQVTVASQGRHIPLLVAGADLAGLPTTATTSALQFRQRLIADAAVRSLDGQTQAITVTALPFNWNPGQVKDSQGLARAFALPVVVPQSAIGALDRPGVVYRGGVRPTAIAFNALSPAVIAGVHALRTSGGSLAAIMTSDVARRAFTRAFAMSGSAQWRVFPRTGVTLITTLAAADHAALAKVSITGPPFVAMSSNSGRFPLTVTNGLGRAITVTIAVKPADPGLSVEPIDPVRLDAGQRRDVQVVTTAAGSGVTSVQARLTPAADGAAFGRPWRFDVRSTQIGLVIWIVMGVGGAVLFIAAGYRIVNRVRGHGNPRRRAPAG